MIQREDLVAAASLGLLQYRQIDPLLIFLLQRDVRVRREVLLAQARPARMGLPHALLSYLTALLAIITAVLFAVLFAERAVDTLGVDGMVFLSLLYAAAASALIFWFKRLGFGIPVRILSVSMLALVPAALLALQ